MKTQPAAFEAASGPRDEGEIVLPLFSVPVFGAGPIAVGLSPMSCCGK